MLVTKEVKWEKNCLYKSEMLLKKHNDGKKHKKLLMLRIGTVIIIIWNLKESLLKSEHLKKSIGLTKTKLVKDTVVNSSVTLKYLLSIMTKDGVDVYIGISRNMYKTGLKEAITLKETYSDQTDFCKSTD